MGKLVIDAFKSVQSRPADQFHSVPLQVKISGQNGFDVARVRTVLHRVIQLDHAAEFVTAAILCIGQYELRVVLGGHVTNLRLETVINCAPEHKFPVADRENSEI